MKRKTIARLEKLELRIGMNFPGGALSLPSVLSPEEWTKAAALHRKGINYWTGQPYPWKKQYEELRAEMRSTTRQ